MASHFPKDVYYVLQMKPIFQTAHLKRPEPRLLCVISVGLHAQVNGLSNLVGHSGFIREGSKEVPGDPLVIREGLMIEVDARGDDLETREDVGVDLTEEFVAVQRSAGLKKSD